MTLPAGRDGVSRSMMLRRRIGSWGHMRLFGAEDDIDVVATFTPREQAKIRARCVRKPSEQLERRKASGLLEP